MAQTWAYSIKCMSCGLHFKVYSWRGDWLIEVGVPCCPECGKRNCMALRKEPLKGEIYQHVSA